MSSCSTSRPARGPQLTSHHRTTSSTNSRRVLSLPKIYFTNSLNHNKETRETYFKKYTKVICDKSIAVDIMTTNCGLLNIVSKRCAMCEEVLLCLVSSGEELARLFSVSQVTFWRTRSSASKLFVRALRTTGYRVSWRTFGRLLRQDWSSAYCGKSL